MPLVVRYCWPFGIGPSPESWMLWSMNVMLELSAVAYEVVDRSEGLRVPNEIYV